MKKLHELGLFRDMDFQIVASLVRTFYKEEPKPDDTVQALLALAIRATADGHVCLDLSQNDWGSFKGFALKGDSEENLTEIEEELAQLPLPSAVKEHLLQWPKLVGDGTGLHPFVLEENRLYLRRFWNYERQVAEKLTAMAEADEEALDDTTKAMVETLTFSDKQIPLSDGQKKAIRKGISRKLTIITGGPGTGKTTVAALLLKVLAEQQEREGNFLRVRMAAPTGKAAARLEESINQELKDETVFLEKEPASTIERLLGFIKDSPYFRYNRNNLLPADILLIDEASMIDLPKMAKLLDAISKKTRLVLLGDKDQLASVDPGSVMAELCQSKTLAPCVAVLTENHRFNMDSAVTPLSEFVKDGSAEKAWETAVDAKVGAEGKKVTVHESIHFDAKNPPKAFRESVEAGFAGFLDTGTPQDAFRELEKFRVLCALRRGPQGVEQVNQAIEDILSLNRTGEFYTHRVILVTKNDHEVKLFNGDVGIVLKDESKKKAVYFETGPGMLRRVPCRLLPEHETAFAMTIHKSQGSGFEHILVLLPDNDSPVMTRELIYTAITRTKTGVELWCNQDTFIKGVKTPTDRRMGLKYKLDHR